ncbi:MAG: homoserine dehydrogenase [bacterium]
MSSVKVGLIGYGTIGQGVIRLLKENRKDIRARLGGEIELYGVADADIKSERAVKVNKELLTKDPYKLINDPEIEVIVELAGDWPGVKKLILDSLRAGKSVVTANKALLAKNGNEIFRTAKKHGRDVYYEASVCGTIPIIRVLREGLSANRLQSIYGIVNGTCNYILTEMTAGRGDYADILAHAQSAGYAEARPESDVEGYDAAHKLALLIRLGFGVPVKLGDIYREGISRISSADIMAAHHLGFVVKLLAIAKRTDSGLEARVHPTLVPENTPLASVHGVYNAVYVEGNFSGATLYYGQGAGQEPTAAAVVGDVIELSRGILKGHEARRLPSGSFQDDFRPSFTILPFKEIESEYYLRLQARDRPGVLSRIAGIIGSNDISIRSVIQRNRERGPEAAVIIMTHLAKESRMQKALAELGKLREVKGPIRLIRIEPGL